MVEIKIITLAPVCAVKQGFLGLLFAFAGAMAGNAIGVEEGVAAAVEAGIKIAEIMDDLLVTNFPLFLG
jgi:hypothetical protein